MNFERVNGNAYCEISDCGEYTVAAVGSAAGWTFEPWRGKENLGVGMEAEAAREVCRAHAAQFEAAAA